MAPLEHLARLDVDDIVVHVNPPQFSAVVGRIEAEVRAARTLIGAWAWELDRVPAEWERSAAIVDQIWVPSEFVLEALAGSVQGTRPKIRVMGHRVEVEAQAPPGPERRLEARRRLGLPPHAFVVLTSFSFFSTLARKNPQAAIAAFRRAFPEEDTGVLHVVRCLDVEGYPPGLEVLRAAKGGDPRVSIVEVNARNSSIDDHYAAADAYLSLHRSEGFGLNLAEALHLGLPVIATDWGLARSLAEHPGLHAVRSRLVPVADPQHVYDRVPGARWADPDIEHAAGLLRAVRARQSQSP
ncbi:MAG: glycosyltransferase [Pseudomonadota bacterium]|nr:glycosyltransferase [Pseudomonadota bacterium]